MFNQHYRLKVRALGIHSTSLLNHHLQLESGTRVTVIVVLSNTIVSSMSTTVQSTVDIYPISPLPTFPPTLPNGRQPLRVRCGVTMRLQLSTYGLAAPSWPSPKGHVQPQRAHLPRRRNPRRIVLHDTDEEHGAEATAEAKPAAAAEEKVEETEKDAEEKVEQTEKVDDAAEAPIAEDAYAPAPQVDQPRLQEVLPGLSLAFIGADDALATLPGHAEEAYTHVISVVYGEKHAVQRVQEGRTSRLRLALPPRADEAARAGLGLSDAQLRAARDFVAELQPQKGEFPAGIRVLIATPHNHPANALAIVACYLSFACGKSVEEVLLDFDQEEEFESAWRGEVSDDEIERVEKIARAWSWLSQVVRPTLPE